MEWGNGSPLHEFFRRLLRWLAPGAGVTVAFRGWIIPRDLFGVRNGMKWREGIMMLSLTSYLYELG